ncbi:HD-GYP domain-containing protein [Thalassotalea sp. G2M2-11]|uniref:HD-GYP domain-containing protein n=1 Tax=Thalassotalea sp. G2M2-11 TaxID=2787627 RepID=UPI0019CFFE78|nr:HD-GYP domain-containing protein [Thalassotalea sp. G2M2-11]
MTNANAENNLKTLDIKQLKLGMYVMSVIDDQGITISSEGYISDQQSINQLVNANIVKVVVDPNKEKPAEQVDRVLADISTSRAKPVKQQPKIHIDQEIKQANRLYQDGKALQSKIIESVKLNKSLKIEGIGETTNAVVDSVFRNQDALTCLTRIQSKDSYLLEHSLNCAILMSVFAKHLAIERRIIEQLTLGAFLHDIGKVLIPKEILYKRTALTAQETKIANSHVAVGLKLLEDSPEISHIAMRMVREHHERLDGSGYPQALKANEISQYGRMIAIVDTYDKLTCERPYKKSIFPISAFKTLISDAPSQYDEELVEKFIQCIGVYPVGTLVKLNSGKLGLISQLNKKKPLHPYVKVFYNTRLSQAIPIEEINLAQSKYKDQIDCCIRPEDFNINLLKFFKTAFID